MPSAPCTQPNGSPADVPSPEPHGAAPAPPPNPTENPAASGRDARGRFTKNNRGGPGNPFARQVAALRRALLESVTAEDIKAVAARLVEAAKGGDVAAARLLFSYGVGKPVEAVDPDTLDAREWDLFGQNSTTAAAQVDCVLGSIPVS
jgi:hypothetical protein